jgi:FkbH-like protein
MSDQASQILKTAVVSNKVKLVIWDLDDTFWAGTLEEGGITPVQANIDIVRELALRGIISSICSKNDYDRTRNKLEEIGIWDHFVFPAIRFAPKGKAIAEMIEAAALRPENVLFIDDNHINREEVKFFNPGIMTAHPSDVLHLLLGHPHLAGKADPDLTRLKQYQFLQRKVEERDCSSLSNEEFLRASDVRVTMDYDVHANFDRVVELINRTNQLNYTKLRFNSAEEIEAFKESLDAFGHHAGCIRAVDKYGDYGLVGFYLLRRRSWMNKLIHFVFSCRTMNMGIEQYVYELLDKPAIEIAQPVSYGLASHVEIDWIRAENGDQGAVDNASASRKLVLLGGCDLLQLASYCSRSRDEFVNQNEGEFRVRYDDPGFILGNRALIAKSEAVRKIPYWSYEDAVRFDAALDGADIVLLSLWSAMNGNYYRTAEGLTFRFAGPDGRRIRNSMPNWFDDTFEPFTMKDDEKIQLVEECFAAVGQRSRKGMIFVIGCNTFGASNNRDKKLHRRAAFNEACRKYCEVHASFFFVDMDAVIPPEAVVGNGHFSRIGYFALAQHILQRAGAPAADQPTVDTRVVGREVELKASSV